MRARLLCATLVVLGGASATSSTQPGTTPMLLQANRIIHVAGTRIYCTVEPLLHLGNALYCYDAHGHLDRSYGIEFSSSQLAVLRFAEADKAHIVWARQEP